MKNCEKCQQAHSLPGRFCSRSCANSRTFSAESRLKKSQALQGRPRNCVDYDRHAAAEKANLTKLKKYQDTPFEQLGMTNRRRRVIEDQKYCCARCGLSQWLGQDIPLEIDHRDGNNQNDSRENLEALCPNCHSLTDTWRGRNRPSRNGQSEISDELLLDCLKSCANIRQALLKAGLSARGTNYRRAQKLLEQN
jgi:hypothetical protein